MKIALICPSNMTFMPYVNNYLKILKESNINYTIINWDRFHTDDPTNEYSYRDLKIGHRRNFLDYYNYRKFVVGKLTNNNFDKIIVFGLQLSYFLKKILKNKYPGKYIIDVRDYNKVMSFFSIRSTIKKSRMIVISSEGYKKWLPKNSRFILNHNTSMGNIRNIETINIRNKNTINISCIGALRDLDINIAVINKLKDNQEINLYFHGLGDINEKLMKYINMNKITNVYLTGKYEPNSEENLYKDSNLINVFRENDGINNYTALPNRLYNAVYYGKPLIAIKGTYLSEIIKKFNLGLVIKNINNLELEILDYINTFNSTLYLEGRLFFLKSVIKDNEKFNIEIKRFIKNQN